MSVIAQLIGYPRIGPSRELKWALEQRLVGSPRSAEAFDARIAELRHGAPGRAARADRLAPSDDYFLYDAVLETAMMLGIATAVGAQEQLAVGSLRRPDGCWRAARRSTRRGR